ncbi:MAG: adenosylcobalamin-dependent ribonucleoside-diphosphate reductase [Candidatus Dadabacteria bacterium]|nr:adenosylcobalamin-dependent ribonucleoside-diphosphate reductase [Candidatus Dadabacteria bacterium]
MPGDKNPTDFTANEVSDHEAVSVEEQETQTQEASFEHVKAPSDTIDIPERTIDAFGGDKLRARVFYEKYALRDARGEIIEKTPEQMWRRVAKEIASPEEKKELRKQWEENFYWLLSDFKFIPGGRILFGAGQKRRATLLNCYYMPIKEDSIEGIFEWCKEAARTYSFGGGVGTDISVLRPKGSPVNNSAIYSTGAVSFMDLLSTTTGTIGQSGRRGALMITLKVNHPDIIEFLDIKNDEARSKVQFANISVKVDDTFMEAVEKDTDYELSFSNEKTEIKRNVRARKIWEKLVSSAWSSAEPGLIFWDTVKRYSPTEYANMEVNGVNPCSEQALEDYGNCCLGNVNLSMFVKNAFEGGGSSAAIEWEELEKAFRYSVRFLDNILDYNIKKHPLSFQTKASIRSRRIGVGFTGLGDMLAKLNIKYDTEEGVKFTDELFEHIKNIVYETSSDLAKEKGTFPVFDLETHIANPFVKSMRENVMSKIKQQGLRNACILTVAPVGSGSVLAGTTSGVEPMFALSYLRRSESLSEGEFKVYHPLVSEYMEKFRLDDEADLPDTFVTSHAIKPELRVRMQAAIQKHIDSCISSTVNLPKDISLEEVEKIYFLAWKLGCKGITVYREGSREGILITEEQAKEKTSSPPRDEGMSTTHSNLTPSPHPIQKESVKPVTRPRVLEGFTEAIKTGYGNLYVTVNSYEGKPFEVFVQIGKSGFTTMADAEATGRLISLSLRSGVDVRDVVEQLEAIGGSSPVFSGGRVIMSVPDAIAKVLRSHFVAKQEANGKPDPALVTEDGGTRKVSTDLIFEQCPECGSRALAYESGCFTCKECGFSKCS